LAGNSIVVSGDFGEPERRKEIEQMVINYGGKLATNVSSKTSFIVAGSNMGPSKKQKAIELGIPILNGQEFLQLIINSNNNG
jgi:DNA ligase (NAD+)